MENKINKQTAIQNIAQQVLIGFTSKTTNSFLKIIEKQERKSTVSSIKNF